MIWRIDTGDCRERLAALEDESVQMVVTSPPYYGLRDYGTGAWKGGDPDCDHVKGEMRRGLGLAGSAASTRGGGHKIAETEDILYGARCAKCGAERIDEQIGLEESPEEYVEALVEVFREVRRVLRHDGTLWLNIGDSYNAGRDGGHPGGAAQWDPEEGKYQARSGANVAGLKPKDLIGIPWRLAFALQQDGWYLRSEIIWAKPNPMPESVTDRPTKAHEQVFLLSRSPRYFYHRDAIREPNQQSSIDRVGRKWHNDGHKWEEGPGRHDIANSSENALNPAGRNKRSVWEIATVPFAAAHFATFPPKLVEPCILAGTPHVGSCPLCGTPWTAIISQFRTLDGEAVEGGWDQDEAGRIGAAGVGHWRFATTSETLGWRPSCSCGAPEVEGYALAPDDLDLIESPTGEGPLYDPSKEVGRAGYARPRNEGEGRRTITRYQQRMYAVQLKRLPATKVAELKERHRITDDAWAHYQRTDRAGARPLPPNLLGIFLEQALLDPVEPPEWEPPAPEPAVVLDPFAGAGTTGMVALRHERSFIGIELNEEYAELARNRIRDDAPLMNCAAECPECPETPGAPA